MKLRRIRLRFLAPKGALIGSRGFYLLAARCAKASGMTGDASACTCRPGKPDPECRYEPRIDPLGQGWWR